MQIEVEEHTRKEDPKLKLSWHKTANLQDML